jgi:hypothetical protein
MEIQGANDDREAKGWEERGDEVEGAVDNICGEPGPGAWRLSGTWRFPNGDRAGRYCRSLCMVPALPYLRYPCPRLLFERKLFRQAKRSEAQPES